MPEELLELLPVGSLFGDYRIVRELGRGGMGVVYLGENVRDGARVAVKVLYPEIERQDREYVLRFIREAEIAMAISHPNLISVYDVGRDPETRLGYMIMEYVAGGSVADRLASDGVFSVRQALQIVMAVASALGEASRHGVVHRDIKPDNILFSEDGAVRLSDLGIAKQESGTVQTTLTASQMIIGTPAYMAPEQLLDSHAVDVRADIYSLGVSFWEMLAGKRPYAEDSSMALMARMAKGEPIPDIRRIRPKVSSAVATLIRKMTDPNVQNRLQTPHAVLDFIDGFHRREKRILCAVIAGLVVLGLAAIVGAVCVVLGERRPAAGNPQAESFGFVPVAAQVPSVPVTNSQLPSVVAGQGDRQEPSVSPTNESPEEKSVTAVSTATAEVSKASDPTPAVTAKPSAVPSVKAEPVSFAAAAADYLRFAAEGEVGLEAKILPAVNAARLLDPDFAAYDWDGRDRDGNRALNGSSLDDYRRGLTYFHLERFRRKNGRLPTEPELQEQAKALGAVPK